MNPLKSASGSSPLTRGKPQFRTRFPHCLGLIPAHAGKTSRGQAPLCDVGAHPRSRGENASAAIGEKLSGGSSPLTRGKPTFTVALTTGAGLIPAHAGKTKGEVPTVPGWRAHPRSRGENIAIPRREMSRRGSSPLTRGKLEMRLFGGSGLGLIPAHAGKTASPGRNGVSPRGSSPLTRGKQRRNQDERSDPGLIPAHAGKT